MELVFQERKLFLAASIVFFVFKIQDHCFNFNWSQEMFPNFSLFNYQRKTHPLLPRNTNQRTKDPKPIDVWKLVNQITLFYSLK